MKKTIALLGAASILAMSAAQAAEITGRVTDGSKSVPLSGAEIRVQQTGQRVTTERDGTFRITGLEAGSYDLRITYIGAPEASVSVNLEDADDISSVEVSLGEEVELEDSIVVIGQRGALLRALNEQRAADNIVTVLSSDAIGQLPDENVAEATRRALGVNVLNDQGEGRFVSIRGIDPNLNSVSVNGVRLPSPEAEDRQVPLDVIDSDVLDSIVITKSLTPDLDGDSIGGNIEIRTLSGLGRKDPLAKLKIGGIYSELTEEWGEKISGTYANNYYDGRFGVAISGNYQSREFGSENKEVDGGWDFDNAVSFAEEYELRDYLITRERTNLALNLDYMLSDNYRVYLNSQYSDFEDQEFRSRVENKFEDPDFARADGNVAVFDASTGDPFEVDRDIKDRLETQEIYSIAAGGEWTKDIWQIDYQVSFAYAEEAEPNRLDTDFRGEFDSGEFGLNVSDPLNPVLAFPDSAAEAAYFDTDNYELNAIELTNGISEDEETAFTFNVRKDVMFGENPGFIKTGLKYRTREKSYDQDLDIYEPVNDVLLTDFANIVDYPLDRIGTTPSAGAVRDFFFANINNTAVLELEADDSLVESRVADYDAEEDIWAGYLMAQADINNLRLTGGLRIEDTDYSASGFLVDEDAATITQITTGDSYTDVLPSVNARYEFSENLIGRAAYFASIIRPNFNEVAPRALTNEDNEVEAGNPDLDRAEADSFDLSLEYYPDNSSVIQGGIFYKNIENFISTVFSETAGTFNGITYEELATSANIGDAEVWGIEFGYQRTFDALPAPWDGLLAGVNFTYVDADVELDAGGTVALPNQSEYVANLIVGYDKGPWDLRAAVSYRDEYVDELGAEIELDAQGGVVSFSQGDFNRVVLDHTQIDLSAKYKINDNFKLFIDYKNTTDEPFQAAQRYSQGDFLGQFEEYGYTINAGLVYKY